eukprot:CAMPEP_0196811876 /NCGR_PEP_ID=MMETSP1362-20130617/20109_1 /TAXON_ID=163516 /ORGANISM="Leptocylindrus danicus, Strain CCMP1856" /LENGTH=154 /DNA_ID=CAMNT_0042187271 /DNA_START=45 /DNA_END=512 /DNA_ORIENTATION=-
MSRSEIERLNIIEDLKQIIDEHDECIAEQRTRQFINEVENRLRAGVSFGCDRKDGVLSHVNKYRNDYSELPELDALSAASSFSSGSSTSMSSFDTSASVAMEGDEEDKNRKLSRLERLRVARQKAETENFLNGYTPDSIISERQMMMSSLGIRT